MRGREVLIQHVADGEVCLGSGRSPSAGRVWRPTLRRILRSFAFWICTVLAGVATLLGYLGIGPLHIKSPSTRAPVPGAPPTDQYISSFVDECRQNPCKVLYKKRLGTGLGQVEVAAVQQQDPKALYAVKSSVVVLAPNDTLRWTRGFSPGYGVIGMDTDVTGNIFVEFAVTNHSSIAWVLSVTPSAVEDFGTIAGDVVADEYAKPDGQGLRALYAYRSGWPANVQHYGTALRDVFEWRSGGGYKFTGCETYDEYHQSLVKYPTGSSACPTAIGRYDFDLQG